MRGLLARAPIGVKVFFWDIEQRLRIRRSPIRRIVRAFTRKYGLTVRRGPFQGRRFPDEAKSRVKPLAPFLTGSYENELHEPLMQLLERGPYERVVDIGAAEGYYAVGLARALPNTRVTAYEMLPVTARQLARMAQENGVSDRFEIRGECRPEDLADLDGQSLFVFCDAEGAEQELMDPERVPALKHASGVIELHEWARPGVSEEIVKRFEPTHEVRVVHSGARYMSDYPELMELSGVTFEDRELGVSEIRHSRCAWAILTPRA